MTVVSDVEELLRRRLEELEAERSALDGALVHLSRTNPRKRPGRPRGSRSEAQKPSSASGRRRQSRKGGTRSDHALVFIEKHPGTTATQIADELKIKVNYVYRVLGGLVKDGKIRKDGTAYWPTTK